MGMDRAIKKKRWTVKRIIWLAIIAVTATTLTWATINVSSKSTRRINGDYLTLATVNSGQFRDFTSVQATVEPSRSQQVNIQQGGTVAEVYVEAGDIVKAGDPLVRFEDPDFELSMLEKAGTISDQINRNNESRLNEEQVLRNLKSQLLDAEYNLKKAEREVATRRSLFEKQLVSKDEMQRMQDDLDYQKRKLNQLAEDLATKEKQYPQKLKLLDDNDKRAQLRLESVEKSIDKLITRAPISGQLIDMEIEVGERKSSELLGRIDNIDTFILSADVGEYYINRVKKGQTAAFTYNGQEYQAIVDKVFPTITNGNFKIRMVFDQQPDNMRRGLTLQLQLELGAASDSLLLADGAFYQDTGGNWAFVLDEGGNVATRREISVGRRNSEVMEIRSGLRAGERVIISSYNGLDDIDEVILTK